MVKMGIIPPNVLKSSKIEIFQLYHGVCVVEYLPVIVLDL
jgi:hypothetical protein